MAPPTTSAPMAPPRELIPDALAEILLRLPPSDPASLVRASAVCKPWLRTLTDPAFLRRYRAFHGAPLVLGFLHNPDDRDLPRFVPNAAFRQPRATAAAADHRKCCVLDCRHGRALLYDFRSCEFVAWDPITGRESRIPDKKVPGVYTNHAVLCAAAGAGCDHSGCGGGPFLMASVGVFRSDFDQVDGDLFSLETGARIPPTDSLYLEYDRYAYSLEVQPAALVGGALYFVGSHGTLLRYKILCGRPLLLSLVKLPKRKHLGSVVAMEAEDGGLGLASMYRYSLHLWSRETGAEGDASWVERRVIDLKKLLPVSSPKSPLCLSGFAQGADFVLVSTDDDAVFTIDLKSLQVSKVREMDGVRRDGHIIPYLVLEALRHFLLGPSDILRAIRGYNLANGM
ncbi:unnamed protein product [Urochloa decumbens]|uniref:F-box domain-containing protein n=1 Tax=Urochloa decumbens TaxID=240449 RepID=A0ABC9F1T6_9POAL